MSKDKIDYKEYARQMRENCAKGYNGTEHIVFVSLELWEEIATIIEGFDKQNEGEWIDRYNNDFANPIYACSICGKGTLLKPHIDELDNMVMVQALSSFCPNCGSKMKGGAE